MLILGSLFLKEIVNIKAFFWLFSVALSLVVLFTLFNHSQYGFDEKSGHWVMNPFFKDHTIYGAIIAVCLPFVIGLWILEKGNPLYKSIAIVLFFISTDASNLERINRWDCAISMFKERPIVCFGPGTYSFEYARFQDPENITIISTNFGNLGNAHSEYLGALSETGIIGALLFIIIVIYFFHRTISLYQKFPPDHGNHRTILLVILFSISTYFSHAFLNNFLDTDKAAVPIWGMLSIVLSFDIYFKSLSFSNPK